VPDGHDDVGQTGDALQAVWLIEVGKHGSGPVSRQKARWDGSRNERENTVMAKQAGQDAAGNITAADDQ
jgi:hypothetical protein